MRTKGSQTECIRLVLWRTFTRLQVHEEHDVGTLPHSPEELDHPGRTEHAPRAHLLQAEAPQRNLGSEADSWNLKATYLFSVLRSSHPLGCTRESRRRVPDAEDVAVGAVLDVVKNAVLLPLAVLAPAGPKLLHDQPSMKEKVEK